MAGGLRLRELLAQLIATSPMLGGRENGVRRAELYGGFLRYLPGITGGAVILLTEANVRAALWTTDDVSERIDQLQLLLGEGPSVDAYGDGGPVLVSDLSAREYTGRWPVFTSEAMAAGARAIFVFPLQVGAIRLGLLELYRDQPGELSDVVIAGILQVCDTTTLVLLDRQIDHQAGLEAGALLELAGQLPARWVEVHQATGMLTVQLGIGVEEAFVRLRARAYAEGRTVDEVARDVVERRLRLDASDNLVPPLRNGPESEQKPEPQEEPPGT